MKTMLIASIFISSAMFCQQANAATKSRLGATNKNASGWYGNIGIILGGLESQGLDLVLDDNDNISSINAKARTHSKDIVHITGKLAYKLSNGKTELFITDAENANIPMSSFEAGISHELKDGSQLTTSYIRAWPYEVWKDPFLTGVARQEIDAKFSALHLNAEYILGSFFSFQSIYGEQSINRDMAGNALSGSLSPLQINQLQRDYKIHSNQLSMLIPISINFLIEPLISHARVNAEGKANTHTKNSLGIGAVYETGLWEFSGEIIASDADYSHTNPISGKKREDQLLDVSFIASYMTPFDWEDTRLHLIIGISENKSNINYYDTQNDLMALSLEFQF